MSEEVTVKISKEQAHRLWSSAMSFYPDWRDQAGRFEVYGADDSTVFEGVTDHEWTFHWCGAAADQVLLQAWFEGQGIACKALWDMAMSEPGQDGYVVLANVTIPPSTEADYWGRAR